MQQLKHIESSYYHYFLNYHPFYFLTIQENLYMIHLYLDLFIEVCNTTNHYYQKQIHFPSIDSTNPSSYLCKKRIRKFSNNFICFITYHNFYVIAFGCIVRVSSESLEDIKIIATVN